MKTTWKEFERLVARIEHTLGPKGVVVKSPDHIPDKVTGELREVDASMRYRIGSVDVLLTIECRKRSRRQDVRWIEELGRKQEDIGAAKTIAVGSKGFSKAAEIKAERYGIELRRLSELSKGEIVKWVQLAGILTWQVCSELTSVRFVYRDGQPRPHPDVQNQLKLDTANAPLLYLATEGKMSTIGKLVGQIEKECPTAFEGLPPDGRPEMRTLNVSFPPGNVQIMTATGLKELAGVELGIVMHVEKNELPMDLGFSYADGKSAIAFGVEALVPLPDKNIKVLVIKDATSAQLKVRFAQDSPQHPTDKAPVVRPSNPSA